MAKKPNYRIRNWSQYNKSLVQRGSITLWFSEDAIQKWTDVPKGKSKGRPFRYSSDAILCALLLRTVYHLPLRATQGFLQSLMHKLNLFLPVPCYTQISRRAKNLGKSLLGLSRKLPKDIVFDSTGLKVYGEGEWKVRKHGVSQRRTWRKFHIGADPKSNEIIIAELTGNGAGSGDAEVAKNLLPRLPKSVKRVTGDGAYDAVEFRRGVEQIGAKTCVPPPRGAVVREETTSALTERNNAIKEITGLGEDDEARALWKKLTGYHKRSLAETAMYRLKQITGSTLRSREYGRQRTESMVKCLIINKMTQLGMPKGVWI